MAQVKPGAISGQEAGCDIWSGGRVRYLVRRPGAISGQEVGCDIWSGGRVRYLVRRSGAISGQEVGCYICSDHSLLSEYFGFRSLPLNQCSILISILKTLLSQGQAGKA
jgi:hypothetical protein